MDLVIVLGMIGGRVTSQGLLLLPPRGGLNNQRVHPSTVRATQVDEQDRKLDSPHGVVPQLVI